MGFRLHSVPRGIREILHWISKRYENPHVFVTESGVNLPEDPTLTYNEAVSDNFRINYLSGENI